MKRPPDRKIGLLAALLLVAAACIVLSPPAAAPARLPVALGGS